MASAHGLPQGCHSRSIAETRPRPPQHPPWHRRPHSLSILPQPAGSRFSRHRQLCLSPVLLQCLCRPRLQRFSGACQMAAGEFKISWRARVAGWRDYTAMGHTVFSQYFMRDKKTVVEFFCSIYVILILQSASVMPMLAFCFAVWTQM